jgi:hypothetical protein
MPNGGPMTSVSLGRILGIPTPKMVKVLDRIAAAGVSSREEETGALVNRRMVKDERIRQLRTEAGKLGGNPDLLKQEDKQMVKQNGASGEKDANQISTPSSSSSSSISSSGEEKKIYGLFQNVKLTRSEHAKLVESFGESGAQHRIENLSSYVASKGKKYSSHYATLLVWERKNGNRNGADGNGTHFNGNGNGKPETPGSTSERRTSTGKPIYIPKQ